MRHRNRSEHGFTLIELMMSAAIIGVMAAIAIPQFIQFQARSRQAEAYTNLAGIGRSYKSFFAEAGRYPDMLNETGEPTLPVPAPILGTAKLTWDPVTEGFFDITGFAIDGDVVYTYDVHTDEAGDCSCTGPCFTATAHGDADGDGNWSALMLAVPQIDGSGSVVGECTSGVGGHFAPVYNEVSWNRSLDRF